MTRLVLVGDLMVDVLARLPGPLAPGSDTPAPVGFHGGGAAANVAAWAAAAGAAATFVGRVGDDPFGRQAVADLEAAGVEVRVRIDPVRPTGICLVLVDPNGERTMVPSPGANDAPVDPADLPATADWLYLSGYALLRAGAREGAGAALAVARERGWSLAVDAASAEPLAGFGADRFLDRLGRGVLLLANEDEARVLTGLRDPAAGAAALAARCGQAVVKCGPAGAVWSDGTATASAPAQQARVVDTTGAGDAFAAGFLTTVGGPAQRLRRGVDLAALAVARVGGRPGRRA